MLHNPLNIDKTRGCIYKIYSVLSNKVYYGSSISVVRRFSRHKRELKTNCHANKHLQNTANKYGLESIVMELVENVEKVDLREKEKEYILKAIDEFGRDLVLNVTTHTACIFDDPEFIDNHKKNTSARTKLLWKNKEYRDKIIAALLQSNKDEATILSKSRLMKQYWKDGKIGDNLIKAVKQKWKNKEYHKMMSDRMKENNRNEDYTNSRLTALKDACKTDKYLDGLDDRLSILNSKENLAKRSEMMKVRNADPEFQKIANQKSREVCSVKVMCVDLDMEFASMSDAARWLIDCGKTKSHKSAISKISLVCSGSRRIAFGYSWVKV